jgi:hypothetical protein
MKMGRREKKRKRKRRICECEGIADKQAMHKPQPFPLPTLGRGVLREREKVQLRLQSLGPAHEKGIQAVSLRWAFGRSKTMSNVNSSSLRLVTL